MASVEGWKPAHEEDGITTFFRKDEGDNTLAWRTHGEIDDCPVISQVGGWVGGGEDYQGMVFGGKRRGHLSIHTFIHSFIHGCIHSSLYLLLFLLW